MTTKRNLAVTEAAHAAGTKLSAFAVLEAEARRRLEQAQEAEPGNSFAEFHFSGGSVQGVVKVNNLILKVED